MRSGRVADVIEAEVMEDERVPISRRQFGLQMTGHIIINFGEIVDEKRRRA